MMTINKKTLGLYLHIPFCLQKCRYCGFLSFDGIGQDLHSAYARALAEEIRYAGRDAGAGFVVDTIFVGGGTPSILSGEALSEILSACRESFVVADEAEITLESNPKTLTVKKLKQCREAGFNRLSIGVQSLDDDVLSLMGRAHRAEDAKAAVLEAKAAGYDNINIDLMFGIPGQTPETWEVTLAEAILLAPEHLSFYSLQIEENTPFEQWFREGKLQETTPETDRRMYHNAILTLQQNGYEHYEISNAAKPGYRCRHNMKYWQMQSYLGLGLGAHSYLENRRSSNETELSRYLSTKPPHRVWEHQNTERETIAEYLFTGLRMMDGVSFYDFETTFGASLLTLFREELRKHFASGLLCLSEDGRRLRLTSDGIDLSNSVMADFVE